MLISSPVKTFESKTVGQELVINTQLEQPSLAREDFGLVPQASKKDDKGSHFDGLSFVKRGSRPAPQTSKKGKRVAEQPKTPGVGVEDILPWVSPISSHPPPPPPY